MNQVYVDLMQQQDIVDCANIATHSLDCWSKEQIQQETQLQVARIFCVKQNQQVIGFAAFHLVLNEAMLNTLVIHPDFRAKGFGKTLLEQSFAKLKQQGAEQCFLEVRKSNFSAQKLYINLGFQEIGLRKKFYQNPTEDGIVMSKIL